MIVAAVSMRTAARTNRLRSGQDWPMWRSNRSTVAAVEDVVVVVGEDRSFEEDLFVAWSRSDFDRLWFEVELRTIVAAKCPRTVFALPLATASER